MHGGQQQGGGEGCGGLHQVFLDDYIGSQRPEIVDARRRGADGQWRPVPFVGGTKGVHLIRVDTVAAVLHPNYFVRVFEDSIRTHLFSS